MAKTNAQSKKEKLPSQQTMLLDIPPRLQWDNGNGYCGETALQSIGLFYGAWLSQGLIRDINKGEFLLQQLSPDDRRDPIRTIARFHFTYNEWDWMNSPQPQFRYFCRWMKRSILQRHPVMFGIFLPDMDSEDYDHIVPAVGIRYKNRNEYDPDDTIIYYDLYVTRKFEGSLSEDEMGSTRKTISRQKNACDGRIPLEVTYGIAITGIVDEDRVTVPVRLAVSKWDEPNLAFNEDPIEMDGIVTVYNLNIGNTYVLLRYSSYKNVPTKGDADAFIKSLHDFKHEFIADNTSYIYEDPEKIPSKGSVYYRCVLKPDECMSTR
ncbi:unnamed protein product [Rotaria socialis]|uniref:Peptidase C39-like domain-containing protein n=1 Tax=Rotaria socialis TaxID=392032 RepID=A0A818VH79_9BILA|nr:unnamed protein product [Rotaria socialis]CAF4255872.1 unnamed protein product [Rotaria socialis]